MDELKILLGAMIDKSSLTDIQKQVAKEKISMNVDLNFAKALKESKDDVLKLSKQFKEMFNFSDREALSFTKEYISKSTQLIKEETRAQESLVNSMTRGREASEKAYQAEKKRQELAQSSAINKAADQEYASKQKLVEQMASMREKSELAAKAEQKRQEVAQANASNKAMDQQYRQASIEAEKTAISASKINEAIASGSNDARIEQLTASLRSLGYSTEDINKRLLGVNDAFSTLKSSSDNTSLIMNAKTLDAEYAKVDAQIKQISSTLKGFATESQKISSANNIAVWADNNSKAMTRYGNSVNQMISRLRSADDLTVPELKKIEAEFKNIQIEAREAGLIGKTLGDSAIDATKKFGSWATISGGIVLLTSNVRKAISELKDVNTILTEISKTNETLSKSDLTKLGSDAFDTASKYGQKASDYLLGVQEASRAGYTNAEPIAELSTLAQSAGDMTAELANNYIIATDAAYKLQGQTEKLNAVLDGQNYITNRNALSMSDLADATRVSASQAASAGVDVDKMTAAVGTMIATTRESGDTMGRAFKAILMNVQQVKGTVDESTGEIIGEEDLTKYEKAADALGVKLKEVKDGYLALRDPMVVLKELSQAYTSLNEDDARRANLISAIGGKYRGNALNALLENWDKYEKMLSEYSQGSGSAMDEAAKSANNWQGSLNRLSNTWTDTIGNVIKSDDVIKLINNLNQLLTTVNKLTGVLGTWGTLSIGAGIFAGIKNNGIFSVQNDELALFGKSINQIKTDLTTFNETSKSSTVSLGSLKAAINGTTISAKAGAAALKGLSIAGNMIIFLAITKTIEFAVKSIDDYIHRVEIAKEAMQDSASSYQSVKSELDGINSELKTQNDRMQELLSKDKLTYAEKGELDNLKQITEELKIQQALNGKKSERSARELASASLSAYRKEYSGGISQKDINNYTAGATDPNSVVSPAFISALNGESSDLSALIAAYEVLKQKKQENSAQDEKSTEIYKQQFQAVSDSLDEQVQQLQIYQDNLEKVPIDKLTKDQKNALEEIKTSIKTIWSFTDPNQWNSLQIDKIFNTEGIEKTKDELIQLALSGKLDEKTIQSYKNLNSTIKNSDLILGNGETAISSFINEMIALSVATKNTGGSIEKAFEPISKQDLITNINSLSEGFESLDKIMNSIKDKNPFDYALLDDKNFKETFSGLGKDYTDFIETISSSPDDVNATRTAFDKLVTTWIDSSGVLNGLSSENSNLAVAMLKNMGVANAEEVVMSRLAIAQEHLAAEKAYTTDMSDALSNATASEIPKLIDEATQSDIARVAIAGLALAKMDANGTALDTSGDIENVQSLIGIIGSANIAINAFNRIKAGDVYDASAQKSNRDNLFSSNTTLGLNTEIDKQIADYNNKVANAKSAAEKEIQDAIKAASEYRGKGTNTNFNYAGGTKTNKPSSSGSKEKTKKDFSEIFDWVQVTIDRVNEKIDKLKDKISDANGWKSKNEITGTALDEMSTKVSALESQLATYQGKLKEAGDKLNETYIGKIKDGTMEVETVTDEVISNNIKDYQNWYSKINDVNKELDDTKKEMQELAKSRLDNIINDFESITSLMDKYSSYSNNLLNLQKSLGEEISNSDYEQLIDQQEAIYNQLQNEYGSLSSELAKAVSAGTIKTGSDEWRKYNGELIDINSSMNDAVSSMNDFRKALMDLPFEQLQTVANEFDRLNSGMETMLDVMGSEGTTLDGMVTAKGLAQIALYGKQYANSKQLAAEYANAIDELNNAYENGSITQSEYNDKLGEFTSAQLSAVKATKEAEDAILQFRKTAIQEQIDDYNELIAKKKEALQQDKTYADYLDEVSEKQKNISTLQAKIDELSTNSDSSDRAAIATRLQLENDLASAKKDLAKTQADYAYDQTTASLDKQAKDYEDAKNKELNDLETSYDAQQKVIQDYLGQVKDNYKTVYNTLTQYGENYNISATEDLVSPWDSASSAVDTFQNAVSDAISQINIDLASIDLSNLTEMVNTMNGMSGGSNSIGGNGGADLSQFEDVSGTGSWQKGKGGKDWYGNSNKDYLFSDIYTIDGNQYAFDDFGYMKTGWDESSGSWRYFDPANGQMVKSNWRKGADGKDYYLTADGSMATDMAIKAKSGNGYYYVDENGAWDGNTISYDDVKKRNIEIGYANGTKNSVPGLKYVEEDKPELIYTKDGTLLKSAGGDMIFNGGMLDNLWNLASDPSQYIGDKLLRNQTDLNSIRTISRNVEPVIQLNAPLMTVNNTDENTMNLLNNRLNVFATKELPIAIQQNMKIY